MKKSGVMTGVLLVTAVLVGAGTWFFGIRPLQNQTNAILKELQSNSEMREQQEEERQDTVDGKGMVAAAKEKGQAILKAIPAYRSAVVKLDDESADMDAVLEEMRTAAKPIQEAFSGDAGLPWYADNGDAEGTWTMAEPYTFDENGVNCLFLCKSKDGQLLAYAETYYDTETGQFDSFLQTVTSYGNSFIQATGENQGTEVERSTSQIMEWAESNKVEPGRDMTDEEKTDREQAVNTRELQQEMYANGYIDSTGQLTEEGQKWVKQHPEEAGPWADQVNETEGGTAE